MSSKKFTIKWLCIIAIALFDCAFALYHANTFGEWELNPLARGVGVYGAVAMRLFTVFAAMGVISLSKVRNLATHVVFAIHICLLMWYGGSTWMV